jgi:L-ascorbate metabolism protein UlaG (beta-lactamase superfamily)
MKLTKHPHAHLTLEQANQKLIIDPGIFSADLGDIANVTAIIVTHSHADHLDADHITQIQAANPSVQLFTTADVAELLDGATVVQHGERITVGAFELRFYGQEHASIHESVAVPDNIGVLVNDTLYYPGDAFTIPEGTVKVLAVPGNAPWATVGQAMDFIVALKPDIAFPTHNALLSEAGHQVYNTHLDNISKESGTEFHFLQPGDSIEI